jgi:hypothetical protein
MGNDMSELVYEAGEVPGMNEKVRQSVQSALDLLLYGEDDVDLKPTAIALLKDALGNATPSRESSDELAALGAKYLGMDLREFADAVGAQYEHGVVDPVLAAAHALLKSFAGSVVSQARGDK